MELIWMLLVSNNQEMFQFVEIKIDRCTLTCSLPYEICLNNFKPCQFFQEHKMQLLYLDLPILLDFWDKKLNLN